MKNKKICFISSSGGHFAELKNLSEVIGSFDNFLVTEKVDKFSTDMFKKVYFVSELNRKEKFFIFKFAFSFIKQFFIFLKTRPSVVISTGALSAYPMMKIAKMFGKKVIYIESYARVTDLSACGRKVYKFADLFLVQWPELAQKYEKAKYVGNFFTEAK